MGEGLGALFLEQFLASDGQIAGGFVFNHEFFYVNFGEAVFHNLDKFSFGSRVVETGHLERYWLSDGIFLPVEI